MADETGISWTDSTWNPWRGCTKVSPGCAHCYMFRDQRRYGNDPEVVTRAAPATFTAPLRMDGARLIFTCSWSDWFHEDADGWRDEAWDIVRRCPQHTFQILTKRPELVTDRLPADWGDGYPNVWLGVSIENTRHTWRADVLRQIPAALRFISAEPLLGSLYKLPRETPMHLKTIAELEASVDDFTEDGDPAARARWRLERPRPLELDGIDWVIVGGESGAKAEARPLHPVWAREIRDAVQAVGHDLCGTADLEGDPRRLAEHIEGAFRLRPALHFKQWGSWTPDEFGRDSDGVWLMPDGTRHTSFNADIYGIDLEGAVRVRYAGPRPGDGGKFLDGTDWCEIPERPDVGQLTLA